ncbi:alpha/beta hydrolase family protein [Chiayiivirga flava]|uniref:Dipeptidyl aminopeptidase/acylaminoacyl peptidase n=1 Tax=Chiayiivirga flava TaxID=659595 RepID=A0A7W8D612_9GAMM|nr:S9 family peptidase [Chiayiivirga flava]MBB5208540.1 dipeptidyl aminopeptidase/acylaminoacyl peptidase [Chiayiivirga flava]
MRFRFAATFVLAFACTAPAFGAPPSIEDFAADADFDIEQIKLSPTGDYLALTVPLGDRTGLLTLRLSDMSRVGAIQAGRNTHIADLEWIGPERLVYSMGQKYGDLKAPIPTGELYGIDVDGGNHANLVGYRAGDSQPSAQSRIQRRKAERIFATLIEPVKDDPTDVFIASFPFGDGEARYTQVDRLDVRNGRRIKVASAPVTRASFTLDHAQRVRFARGEDVQNVSKLYYRPDDDSDWVLLNDQSVSKRLMIPLGFSADDAVAYLLVDETSGPRSVQAMDPATRAMREAARDSIADPYEVLYSPYDDAPIGVMVAPGLPRAIYFDPDSDAARLHRALQASFPGQTVRLRRATADGGTTLFTVAGDRNSGEIYSLDLKTKKAAFVTAASSRIDPETLGKVQPIDFEARDGTRIHGYLTLPPGSDGKNLPMVVMPHGGPFGIFDTWTYDTEAQLLATRGYAVLQPNFRGSGGYGAGFEYAGYKQWGRLMQDDVTDATRWAIAQGIADAGRICIHGSSYGGYAALMGAAREPALYRCASGNVGVYDLRTMLHVGDTASVQWGRNYLKDVMDLDRLAEDSPLVQAGKIRVPVLLSAGAEDERAPPTHTERMENALRAAGVPVDAKVYKGEGHTYFLRANVEDYYTRLVAFMDRHIGKDAAPAAATAAAPTGSTDG